MSRCALPGQALGGVSREHTKVGMTKRARSRCRLIVAGLLVAALSASSIAAGGATNPAPKFRGPVLSRNESFLVSLGRDGGFSVGLPNGRDLWIFGDTPRYEYSKGAWRLTQFIGGSTAAARAYTPGKSLTG